MNILVRNGLTFKTTLDHKLLKQKSFVGKKVQ